MAGGYPNTNARMTGYVVSPTGIGGGRIGWCIRSLFITPVESIIFTIGLENILLMCVLNDKTVNLLPSTLPASRHIQVDLNSCPVKLC